MRNTWIIAKREIGSYFATPLAYIFIAIFAALTSAFAFYLGGFFERSQADLQPFFDYHPWLLVLLVPSLAMRLWAEERKSGSLELLMTLPVSTTEAVIGKFIAAWVMMAVALMVTAPMWITVNYLGSPDNGVIAAAYFGSWLLAGAFLAIGAAISATTKNQVIAFVVATAACFVFVMSGLESVLQAFEGWLPRFFILAISSMSFLNHYDQLAKGVVEARSIIFFLSMIVFWLFANIVIIDQKKTS
jgi:ABC-2 type transport system permease protein